MTLQLESVSLQIGDFTLLDKISGQIEPGETVLLVGPNGAGKSSLANVIGGGLVPTAGKIFLQGNSINRLPTYKRARCGISRMFQRSNLAWNLTSLENVLSGLASKVSAIASRRDRMISLEQALDFLQLVGLKEAANRRAGDLSFGQQRLLALARALAIHHSILILDEPFTGLKGAALETILSIIEDEGAKGTGIIVIDHLLQALSTLSAKVWFMDRGRISQFPCFEDMLHAEVFRQRYLKETPATPGNGASIAARRKVPEFEKESSTASPILEFRNSSISYGTVDILSQLNLRVYAGESIFLIGLNGAGKSTVLRAVAGLANVTRGEMLFNGANIAKIPSHTRMRMGIRYLPQGERLFRKLSVDYNKRLTSPLLGERAMVVSEATSTLPDSWGALPAKRLVGTLSGGEQARLALGGLDLGQYSLLMLDEPTSGLDSAGRTYLAERLELWRSRGLGLLVVEHDLEFVLATASRVFVVTPSGLQAISLSTRPSAGELLEGILRISQSAMQR